MFIHPIGDRLLLKKVEKKEETQSGLILTSTKETETQFFTVVEVGDGKKPDGEVVTFPVGVGDTVILDHFVKCFNHEGEEYVLVTMASIAAYVSDYAPVTDN